VTAQSSPASAVLPATGADTLATLLARRAREQGKAVFLVFEDLAGNVSTFTYAAMLRRAARTANLLRRLGICKGATFHVHLPNCPEFYDCWFGGALLGAVMVPTNPLSTADELAYILAHAECAVSITQPDLFPAVAAARPQAPALRHVLIARTSRAEPGTLLYDAEAAREPDTLADPPALGPLDVAGMLYTSGTTSRPKGVLITNANYLYVGEVVAQHLRIRPDDRLMIVLPLFHGNAQYYSTMSALVTGASVALVERFSASRFAQQAARLEATVASLFAAPIRMILAQPPGPHDRAHRLRVALFAQNVTEEQLAAFEARFGCPLLQIYGMTETVAPPTMNPLYGERRNMTIGRPILAARLRVVDADGRDVPASEVGQLLVHGEPG
jgi:crotonobetaine/carnitine-CoA ligase